MLNNQGFFPSKKTIFGAVIVLLLVVGLGVTLFVAQRSQQYRSKATVTGASMFRVAADKTAIKPGETVTFSAYLIGPDGVSKLTYEGGYEVEVMECKFAEPANCTTIPSASLDWIVGKTFSAQGTLVVTIPPSTSQVIYKIRFQPKGVG